MIFSKALRFDTKGPESVPRLLQGWFRRLVVIGVGKGMSGTLTNEEVMTFCNARFFSSKHVKIWEVC